MSTLKNCFVVLTVALAVSAGAYANDKDKPKDEPVSGPQRVIDFAEFKGRCEDKSKFEDQVKPESITIQCTDTHREFVADVPGVVDLTGYRIVKTQLTSKIFKVAGTELGVQVASKGGQCFRFKEVERTFSVERKLDCGDVVGKMATPHDFCVSFLDGIKKGNPKLIDVRETGRVIDSCTAIGGKIPDEKGKDGIKG